MLHFGREERGEGRTKVTFLGDECQAEEEEEDLRIGVRWGCGGRPRRGGVAGGVSKEGGQL